MTTDLMPEGSFDSVSDTHFGLSGQSPSSWDQREGGGDLIKIDQCSSDLFLSLKPFARAPSTAVLQNVHSCMYS